MTSELSSHSRTRSVRAYYLLALLLILLAVMAGPPVAAGSMPDGLTAGDWSHITAMLPSPAAPSQQAYLKASNVEAGDYFGFSVAIDGATAVVGAPFGGNDSADESGAAYVFTRNGTTWSQQAYLKASNVDLDDHFGVSVAIDGDTVVVGATYEDSDGTGEGNNDAKNAGAAYVFTRSGTTWSQQAYLKASNAEAHDHFGESVAIDGDTLVVGAQLEDSDGTGEGNNDANEAGAAYVFTRSGATWSQQAYLKASNADAGDVFGVSVAIDGATVVVGSLEDSNGTGEGNNNAPAAGAAYVFTRSGTTWSQQAYLKASNVDLYDHFGVSVAIDGDTVVVGAPYESSDGTGEGNNDAGDAGAAYVFARSGTTWSQQAYLKASNVGIDDYFGSSVAIDGDTVVVGAENEASNGTGEANDDADDAGAAYVYTRSGATWSQQAYLKASNADAYDYFGCSVAMDGDTLVVGALYESGDGTSEDNNDAPFAGAAYVFDVATTSLFVSAKVAGTTGDGLPFGPHDILRWDGSVWGKWFDGTAAGLTPIGRAMHNINSVWIPDPGGDNDAVMSFVQNGRVIEGISDKVDGMDLVWWDGSDFALWFDGEDVGLTHKTKEKIDALHVLDGALSPVGENCIAYLLISTQGDGKVPGYDGTVIKFDGTDILGFCLTNAGADTTGFWHRLLNGKAEGMPGQSLTSLSASDDGQTLYLTTKGSFNVDSAAGGHSMVYQYSFVSGEFSGPYFSAPAEGLPRQVDALHVVALPNP